MTSLMSLMLTMCNNKWSSEKKTKWWLSLITDTNKNGLTVTTNQKLPTPHAPPKKEEAELKQSLFKILFHNKSQWSLWDCGPHISVSYVLHETFRSEDSWSSWVFLAHWLLFLLLCFCPAPQQLDHPFVTWKTWIFSSLCPIEFWLKNLSPKVSGGCLEEIWDQRSLWIFLWKLFHFKWNN